MLPPLVRRCPDCGHVGLSARFGSVDDEEGVVECPRCGYRFDTGERPWLAGIGLR